MNDVADQPVLEFASQAEWEAWLAEQHASAPGIWLKIAKKDSGIASVSNAEALDVALCYGWIDGQRRALDDDYFLQRYTPRTARSKWSKINRDHVARLTAAGRMQPAGLREVERAQADGRWDAAYDGQRAASVPDDLAQALAQNDAARAFFATLDSRNRYAILYRIQDAKKPETRARRIAQFVSMLADGKKLYP
jgi:uncharacterized protein YdeI (YjbR/CyaY-like superfamily)